MKPEGRTRASHSELVGPEGERVQPRLVPGDGTGWRKSSYSTYNGNCVEVAILANGEVGVRDSKDRRPGRRVLTFSAADWSEFLTVTRASEPRLR